MIIDRDFLQESLWISFIGFLFRIRKERRGMNVKRGIIFKIPNEFGKILGDLLKPFNTETFNWYIGGEESYFIQNDTIGSSCSMKKYMEWTAGF